MNEAHEHGHDGHEHGGGRGKPEHFHARQLEQFSESLGKDGELALQRWGLMLFHSLSDELAQAQREALGFPLRDALDHYNQGCLLASRGDFAGAVRHFDETLKLRPEMPEAQFNRALALDQAGNAGAAREAWKQFVDRNPDHEETPSVKAHLAATAA